jgi:hypothetical protein
MGLRLRVAFTIDIDAEDFIAAAEQQRVLQAFEAQLREVYPQAAMNIKERRQRRLVPQKAAPALERRATLKPYAGRGRATS